MIPTANTNGTLPEVVDDRAFVVYDAATGEIRHFHRQTVFAGAEAPAPGEGEKLAIEAAREHGHSGQEFKVLSIAPDEIGAWAGRRVDPYTGRKIERGEKS